MTQAFNYSTNMKLLIISLIVLIINIPFGYWRANVKKFSLQWILAIHLPVPFIVGLRILLGLGFEYYTYIFIIFAFFAGQKIGSVLHKKLIKKGGKVSSCLVMDNLRTVKE